VTKYCCLTIGEKHSFSQIILPKKAMKDYFYGNYLYDLCVLQVFFGCFRKNEGHSLLISFARLEKVGREVA